MKIINLSNKQELTFDFTSLARCESVDHLSVHTQIVKRLLRESFALCMMLEAYVQSSVSR